MERDEVRRVAQEKVGNYAKLSKAAYIETMEKKLVKVTENRALPGKVEIVKAWVVRFIDCQPYEGAWVDLVISEDGEVIRVDRSR